MDLSTLGDVPDFNQHPELIDDFYASRPELFADATWHGLLDGTLQADGMWEHQGEVHDFGEGVPISEVISQAYLLEPAGPAEPPPAGDSGPAAGDGGAAGGVAP